MPNPTSKLNLVINGATTQLDIHDANAVDLTNNQTVGGNKEFTGTTTTHDVVPSATDTYNLGSPSYQWNNAYIKSLTINGVAAGDILTHNASEFVNVSSNQTIGGIKMFSRISLKSSRIERGSLPSSNITEDSEIEIVDKNSRRILGVFNYYYTDGSGKTSFYVYNPNTTDYDNIAISFNFGGDNQKSLIPVVNNTINFGISTHKWKSFNGVNPGALSLPSGTVGMNLIGDVAVVGAEKKLSKDITVTGFVYVDVSFSSTSSNRLNLYNDTKKYGIWIPCDSGRIRQIMPISAGDRLEFNVLDDGSTVNAIQIFTCQGNV